MDKGGDYCKAICMCVCVCVYVVDEKNKNKIYCLVQGVSSQPSVNQLGTLAFNVDVTPID